MGDDAHRLTAKKTILIVDSQPAARASLRARLGRSGFVVCGEADGAPEAVRLAERLRPDVCMIDIDLPGHGPAAIAEIAAASPATAMIVFTGSDDPDDLFAAIRAGAIGYLVKDMDPERLPHAIRGVLAGEAAIPRRLVAALVTELRSRGTRRVVTSAGRVELSKREWDVAQLLRDGASTAAIAERLFVSQVTVRRHISAIVHKLGAADRQEAAALLAGRGDRDAM